MMRRGRMFPAESTTSSRYPRNQPSTGHLNVCTGVSCEAPWSIIPCISIGGMLGRSKSPAVTIISWRDESTFMTIEGSPVPVPWPGRPSEASSA